MDKRLFNLGLTSRIIKVIPEDRPILLRSLRRLSKTMGVHFPTKREEIVHGAYNIIDIEAGGFRTGLTNDPKTVVIALSNDTKKSSFTPAAIYMGRDVFAFGKVTKTRGDGAGEKPTTVRKYLESVRVDAISRSLHGVMSNYAFLVNYSGPWTTLANGVRHKTRLTTVRLASSDAQKTIEQIADMKRKDVVIGRPGSRIVNGKINVIHVRTEDVTNFPTEAEDVKSPRTSVVFILQADGSRFSQLNDRNESSFSLTEDTDGAWVDPSHHIGMGIVGRFSLDEVFKRIGTYQDFQERVCAGEERCSETYKSGVTVATALSRQMMECDPILKGKVRSHVDTVRLILEINELTKRVDLDLRPILTPDLVEIVKSPRRAKKALFNMSQRLSAKHEELRKEYHLVDSHRHLRDL